jgi:DNA invertase Pin-like site-specific DNA recombinase
MTRAALYARVSTSEAEDKQDPEIQLAALRAEATRRGWQATEFVDRASANDDRRRTAWRALMDGVRRHRFDLVCAVSLGRLARSMAKMGKLMDELEHTGTGLVMLDQPEIDSTSPTGRLVIVVLSYAAEMELAWIKERTRAGVAHARANGKRLGRPPTEERPSFAAKWPAVRVEIEAGRLSRRAAARQLRVSDFTVRRLLATAP